MTAVQGAGPKPRKTSVWPHYDAAVTGLRNYWYPVTWSRAVQDKPVAVQLLDAPVMLVREQGRVRALLDQCPHRGVPLSVGRQEFAGTWTCRYHGWTYDLASGELKAAITDGPDSPICGKVRVQTFPVEERAGLIWVYVGEQPAPPVEADIPEEMLHPDSVVVGRITIQKGNWRYACENSFDDGHAKYLHRYGAMHSFFREMPVWTRIRIITEPGGWITRDNQYVGWEEDFPGLGHFPRKDFWKRRMAGSRLAMRLPCISRNWFVGTTRYSFTWYVPTGANHYRCLQFYVTRASGLEALRFKLWYQLYWRNVHHVQFNNQDVWMVELMPETAPERLYRPDVSITAWRKLCEHARGVQPEQTLDAADALAAELGDEVGEAVLAVER